MPRHLFASYLVASLLVMVVAGCRAAPTPTPEVVIATPVVDTRASGDTSTPAANATISVTHSPLSGPQQTSTAPNTPSTLLPAEYADLVPTRGNNAHTTESPHFEVWYDPTIWEIYETSRLGGSTLAHNQIAECELQLGTGPVGIEGITPTTVQLAGRTWYVASWTSVVAPRSEVHLYGTADGNAGFFFSMLVPETYSDDERSRCREAAEMVIDTFSIVTEAD